MKTITIACGIVIVMGVVVQNLDEIQSFFGNTAEVTKIEKEEIVKEVQPEWATDEDAVEAAKAVLRKKELEAELNALEANFEALTDEYEANKAEYLEQKAEVEKELGVY